MSSSIVLQSDDKQWRITTVLAHAALGRRLLPTAGIVHGRCSCVAPGDDETICTRSKPGKHPRIREWQRQATDDIDTLLQWYRMWPYVNWGWLQDETFALDVDPDRGGLESLAQWEENAGGPSPTLTQRTQSGGYHFIYRQPETPLRAEGDILPGIEIRGQGSYIMVDPSVGLDGRAWTLVNPDTLPAEADDFTLALIVKHATVLGDGIERLGGSGKRTGAAGDTGERLSSTEWFTTNGFGGFSGSRNRDAYRLMWRLLAHMDTGLYTVDRIREIMYLSWQRTDQGDSPFPWGEVIGVMNSAWNRRQRQRAEDEKALSARAASIMAGAR